MSTEVTVGHLPNCSWCGKPATYDAKTQMGPWAFMCEEHFQAMGIQLGTGWGQKLVVKA